MRQEQEIFDELAALAASPGYAHAIAHFCFRDNVVAIGATLTPRDLRRQYSKSRLIRTEIATLIGLLVRARVDYTLPAPDVIDRYIQDTERLLKELHDSLTAGLFAALDRPEARSGDFNPFSFGSALREPIFYGGESAYDFQYREFSAAKYANDGEWLSRNKGLSIT